MDRVKEYICGVQSVPTADQIEKLLTGYELNDGFGKALKVEVIPQSEIPDNPHIQHLLNQINKGQLEHLAPQPIKSVISGRERHRSANNRGSSYRANSERRGRFSSLLDDEDHREVLESCDLRASSSPRDPSPQTSLYIPPHSRGNSLSRDYSVSRSFSPSSGHGSRSVSRESRNSLRVRTVSKPRQLHFVRVTVDLGRNHIVRRLMSGAGLPVMCLHRTKFGPVDLLSKGSIFVYILFLIAQY